MEYALITGASGGIGEALAKRFAADGINLILVARNAKQLERAKSEILEVSKVDIQVHSSDLSEIDAAQELYDWTKSKSLKVRYLINNAGFGDRSDVVDAELGRLQEMVRLNIESLTSLSKLYAKDMVEAKQGNIVNIASVAGFVPGPGMAVYYATKAYVLSYSQALASELEAHNVQVTCICPGATQSGFATAAQAEKSRLFSGDLPTAEAVASFSYNAMRAKKLVAIWGLNNRVMAKLVSLVPRRTLLAAVRRIQ